MAKAPTLARITGALDKWHCAYRVYSGAGTRGRPGGITDLAGLGNHHTGGGSASNSYLYFLFVTGRPAEGIPGPLCNVATDSGGTVNVGAVGRANHFGSGSAATLAHVRAEDYPGYNAELKPGPDAINGNPLYLGNEWIYSGTKPPTAAQYRGAVLWNVAMIDLLGWSSLSAIAHREHTRRKSDPFGVNMAAFRTEVLRVLTAGPKATVTYVATGKLAIPKPPTGSTPAKPPVEDDMAWTEAQLRAMMQAENEEYAIRFWVASGGTGKALIDLVKKVSLQCDRIEDDTDRAPETLELHKALEDSVSNLAAAPAAAELARFLDTDGSTDPAPSGGTS